MLPSPFAGDLAAAKVCILTLNPGFTLADEADHSAPSYLNLRRASLELEPTDFWCLRPEVRTTGAYEYWSRRLAALIGEVGIDAVIRQVLVVEHFPYCSEVYRSIPEILPSQRFGFALARQALAAGMLIVIARNLREWQLAVPELVSHPDVIKVRLRRNGHLSPRTMDPLDFGRIVDRLKSPATLRG